jgi:hypothetical protein
MSVRLFPTFNGSTFVLLKSQSRTKGKLHVTKIDCVRPYPTKELRFQSRQPNKGLLSFLHYKYVKVLVYETYNVTK